MNKFFKSVSRKRPVVHLINSVIIAGSVVLYHVSLPIIMIIGMVMGLFGGKVFCRWFCPIGLLMEKMMPNDPNSKSIHLYQYYKLGCPIAWASGISNRFSLFRISRKKSDCVDCGACDRACYISKVNPVHSLYKDGFKDASRSYTCSRCLACVSSCPTGSLSVNLLSKKTTDSESRMLRNNHEHKE